VPLSGSEFVEGNFKLLKFAENVRPEFYTIFERTTSVINGRKPFAQDAEIEYDFDSEAEWEEDEPGEELVSENDDDEDEPVGNDEAEEEDGWLVPHGYLSDDEGVDEDRNKKAAAKSENPRKLLEKLVPVIVGPRYGCSEGEGFNFKQFEIQFLSGTIFGIDPFLDCDIVVALPQNANSGVFPCELETDLVLVNISKLAS
jgi:hypothetical protein